jgi:hypothetical protein
MEPRPAEEKSLKVRRGRVSSVDLYEIKDSELDLLEHGSPNSNYLNFAIFLLSSAFTAIAALCTSSFSNGKMETLFMIVSVVGILGGAFLLILWWRNRAQLSATIKKIRERIPPDRETSDNVSQMENGPVEPPAEK